MKKIIVIAVKDLLRSLRSMFFIGISIAAPLLLAFLFSIAFGGEESSTSFSIEMAFANQDVPPQGSSNLGAVVQDVFMSEELRDLIHLTEVPDEASALQGILDQRFSAALIIPVNFSSAIIEESSSTRLRIITDPTATIVPQILDYIVTTIADSFSASKITMSLAVEELQQQGEQADDAFYSNLNDKLNSQSNSEASYLIIVDPKGSTEEVQASPQQQKIIAAIMVGMMVFFSFYTGAFASESILLEEEKGTLARKFVSPTPIRTILAGKFLGVFITLLVQVIVLLVSSALIFKIDWGNWATVCLAGTAMIIAAAGFGLFLMSLLRDSRQTGIVLGGVMTFTGMVGGLFTTGIENIPSFMEILKKIVPQGWALQMWQSVIAGVTPSQIIFPVLVLLSVGIVFFGIAVSRFQRRFAKN